MQKFELYLTKREWENKPTAQDTKKYIAKPILQNKVRKTLEELATELSVNSKVCMLGVFPNGVSFTGEGQQLESQEILMLDIDNKNKDFKHFTYAEALENPFVKKHVAFMYKTLSHTDKHERFRMVIPMDRKLTSKKEVTEVYEALFSILRNDFKHQIDEGIKNANRLFYGGKLGFDVVDWENTLCPDDFILEDSLLFSGNLDNKKSPTPDSMDSSIKHISNSGKNVFVKTSIPKKTKPVYELLKQKDFNQVNDEVKNRDFGYKDTEFTTLVEFRNSLNTDMSFSMRKLLDLPNTTENFLDIFHVENDPSANIFRSDKQVELYKCYSTSSEFVGDVVAVIDNITHEGIVKTLNRLAGWLQVKIVEPKEIVDTRESLDWLKSELLSNDLKSKYPYIYKMFWRYTDTFCTLLDIFCEQGYRYNDVLGCYQLLSHMSRDKINKEYALHYGSSLALDTLHTTINLMALSFLIIKLPFKDIPSDLKSSLLAHKKLNGYARYTDVIVVPKFNEEFIKELNDFCKKLSDTQFTKKSLTKDFAVSTYGVDRASNAFSQVKPEERQVSSKFQEVLKDSIAIIEREFKNSDYIVENIIIDRLFLKYKRAKLSYSRADVEHKYKQIRSLLDDGYGYKRVKLTKDIRSKLNISTTKIPASKRPTLVLNTNITL